MQRSVGHVLPTGSQVVRETVQARGDKQEGGGKVLKAEQGGTMRVPKYKGARRTAVRAPEGRQWRTKNEISEGKETKKAKQLGARWSQRSARRRAAGPPHAVAGEGQDRGRKRHAHLLAGGVGGATQPVAVPVQQLGAGGAGFGAAHTAQRDFRLLHGFCHHPDHQPSGAIRPALAVCRGQRDKERGWGPGAEGGWVLGRAP